MPASLFQTPNGERLQIGIFGSRNAGKSSLINALAGQPLSIVSDQKGTTTDPVQKAMELLPIGPVVLIDTPGLDDDSALGSQRIAQTRSILRKANLALLVFDGTIGMNASDQKLLQTLQAEAIPYLLVANKCDTPNFLPTPEHAVAVSAQTGCHLSTLKEQIIACYQKELQSKQEAAVLLGDLVKPGDCVVLVTPIDTSAPKGRLILPQVQAIRDLLDHQACCLVTQPQQLPQMLKLLRQPPKLVVTDSQVFESVQKIVPDSIPLTSFSILFARYKGILQQAVQGAFALEQLPEGATILIAEGCTHHRQCEDIGTVKLPKWIQAYTKKQFQFQWCSGTFFPEDLSDIQLVVHCGGCMLPAKEVTARQVLAKQYAVPFTNYGILIAYLNGILSRSLAVFPDGFSNQLQ